MPGVTADGELVRDQLAAAVSEAEALIRAGRLGAADDLRAKYPAVWGSPDAALELIYAEYVLRRANGETPDRADWLRRYPEWGDRLDRLFGLYDLMAGDTDGGRAQGTVPAGGERAAAPPGEPPAGYEVLGEIGRGGMAVVYKARQVALNRVVAVKVLRWCDWDAADDARRVRREAELVARLQHPHVVQVFEVGEWDGEPFLALEYVPGGTLADALARGQRSGQTGVTTGDAVALVGLLAAAVQAAHEQGVVHRDLKPANVLLADDPAGPFANPKVTDFGLAVSSEVSAAVTQTAALAGTPSYMAPEQAAADRAAVGPRTDVYALGGILYELLTGRPPLQGATVLETLDLVRHAEPVSPRLLRPHLPRDLETICLKCLEKDPARRYESAAALADDLARFADGKPITARPVGAVERGWKWCRRRPWLAGLAAGLVLAVTLGGAGVTREYLRAEDARRTADERRTEAEDNLARSDRMLGHSRQSLAEMVELGDKLSCVDRTIDSGMRILEVARGHHQRMLARDEDPEIRLQAMRVCLRLAGLNRVHLQNWTGAGHALLIEALEHLGRSGSPHLLPPAARVDLLYLAIYANNVEANSGGPTERRGWILDRVEPVLLAHRAEVPNDPDPAVWHIGLWLQRAQLAGGDPTAEVAALEEATRVGAGLPPAARSRLVTVSTVMAFARLALARQQLNKPAEASTAADQALALARSNVAGADPDEGELVLLNEALAARLSVAVSQDDRHTADTLLVELAPLNERLGQHLRGKPLPRYAGYVGNYHKAVAARVAALDKWGRADEALGVLAAAVAARPVGDWKALPPRPVVTNHADLIERLTAAGRTAEARSVVDSALPLLVTKPPTGTAGQEALDRLKKAIDAVPPE